MAEKKDEFIVFAACKFVQNDGSNNQPFGLLCLYFDHITTYH